MRCLACPLLLRAKPVSVQIDVKRTALNTNTLRGPRPRAHPEAPAFTPGSVTFTLRQAAPRAEAPAFTRGS
jgi:hypothetical protein